MFCCPRCRAMVQGGAVCLCGVVLLGGVAGVTNSFRGLVPTHLSTVIVEALPPHDGGSDGPEPIGSARPAVDIGTLRNYTTSVSASYSLSNSTQSNY